MKTRTSFSVAHNVQTVVESDTHAIVICPADRQLRQNQVTRQGFILYINKMAQRMCLSEHPFGTLKRAQGSYYFLLRGNQKAQGEFALFSLGYNIQRMINSLEFENMINQIEAMAHFSIISIFFEPRSIQLEIYY